jgi:Flp pilus assembly protein TadG
MRAMRRLRERRDQGGAAAVEFALVLLPLLYLVFGLVQYGFYFYSMQSGSAAVNHALRRIVVGNCQTVSQVQSLVYSDLGAATTASSSSGVTTTITYMSADGSTQVAAPGQIGGSVTLTVTYPVVNLNFPFIPIPNNGNVTRTNVARVENNPSSSGTCA